MTTNNPKFFTKMVMCFNNKLIKLLVGVFIFTGAFFYLSIYQIQKHSDDVNTYNHSFIISDAVKNINFYTLSIQSTMKGIVLTGNKKDLTNIINLINYNESQIFKELDIISKRYLGDSSDIKKAHQALLDWKQIRQETIRLVMDNKLKEASFITRNKGKNQLSSIHQDVSNLIALPINKASFYDEKAKIFNHNSMIFIVLVCIASILLILYLSYQFNRRNEKENKKASSTLKWAKVLFDSSPEPTLIVNELGNINSINTKAINFFGYSKEESIGLNVSQLIPKRYQEHHKLIDHSFKYTESSNRPMGEEKKTELFAVKKSGEEVAVEISLSFAELDNHKVAITTIRDISDRKKAEKKINHQANYDFLTGTPNRFLSMEYLSQFILDAKREQTKVAVLFIDLDDFKKINDTLGHATGDQVLIIAANKFRSCIREDDIVGRLGGDEFIVLMKNFGSSLDIGCVAKKIINQFNQTIKYDNRDLLLTASIGISIYPNDSQNEEELLRFADIAMYNSKGKGRNQFSFFNNEMQLALNERLDIEHEVINALKQNELTVVYQPKYDLGTEQLIGFEALLRWHNKKLGVVCPTKFIPIMENTGLINDVGMFVLDKALSALKKWQINFDSNFHMAVNFSPIQFNNKNLHQVILDKITEYSLSNQSLEVEITEGLLMKESEHVHHILNSLRQHKVGIALDDFGTGYSSLSYLGKYPFSSLKIDRSFVAGIEHVSTNPALIETTIHMANKLGLKITAEGIETMSQLNILKNLKCHIGQGYLFSKPLSENDISTLLENTTANLEVM